MTLKHIGGSVVRRVGYSKEQLHQKNGASRKVIFEFDCNQFTDESNVVKLNFGLYGLSQPIEKRIKIRERDSARSTTTIRPTTTNEFGQ